jgi:transcriptional regulator with XRE-family HTH domain
MAGISKEKLSRLYHDEDLSQREIGERIGVTQSSVSKWMDELDIESDIASLWTEEEKEKLQEHYPEEKDLLMEKLPERSWNAIKLKAMDLGIAKSAEEHRNSEEVAEKLRELSEQNKIEVNFDKASEISYILGVVDGDGFHDNNGTIGLEVKDIEFAEKFMENLTKVGLNPNSKPSDSKQAVWASSQDLLNWIETLDEQNRKIQWLKEQGDIWKYLEGQYDSDGNLHPSGSPRICSYDENEKKLVAELLNEVGVRTSIQQNNVWIAKSSSNKFFENVNSVLERRRPD